MEHGERGEDLEAQADRMESDRERVDEHIEETRRDWEAKKSDSSIPGAVEDESGEHESAEPPRSDEQADAGQ